MAETARRLLTERAAALASGADTTRLDAAIDGHVSPLLSTVGHKRAAAIEYVLGDLVSEPGSAAQPPGGPGTGAGTSGHPDGKVHPHAVAQPGGIGDRPGVAEPGAQRDSTPGAQRDSTPGAQPGGGSKTGSQSDGGSNTGSQSDGGSKAGSESDGGSKAGSQPAGDAELGARPDREAEHTRPESDPSHPDPIHVPESAPPVLGAGLGPEVILTPVDHGRSELDR
jgi:hypothetical protein